MASPKDTPKEEKNKRAPKFSDGEKKLICLLVKEHEAAITNKSTQERQKAWENISKSFNEIHPKEGRGAEQLKTCYKRMQAKRDVMAASPVAVAAAAAAEGATPSGITNPASPSAAAAPAPAEGAKPSGITMQDLEHALAPILREIQTLKAQLQENTSPQN